MDLTSKRVSEALREAGLAPNVEECTIEYRDPLYLVRLRNDLLAWFATSDASKELLRRERLVLSAAQRCSFQTPELIFVSADESFDVRLMVVGLVDHRLVFEQARADTLFAQRLGAEIGTLLADLHLAAVPVETREALPKHLEWPLSREVVRVAVRSVTDDESLVRDADRALELFESLPIRADDHVLVHGDLGFHNLAFDPHTLAVRGLFDFKDAAWADRHLDFRYLIFDVGRFELLDSACSAYSQRTGHQIDRSRVVLYNAVWAVSFLAFRAGTSPTAMSCGRTLAGDLAWSRSALALALRGDSQSPTRASIDPDAG